MARSRDEQGGPGLSAGSIAAGLREASQVKVGHSLSSREMLMLRNSWLKRTCSVTQLIAAAILGCVGTTQTCASQGTAQDSTDDPAVSIQDPTGGTLQNPQITVEWQIHDGHLAGVLIRNRS